MCASDEVAGLPGGQALAALAAQVKAKPGAIRNIAKRWAQAAADCQAHAASVNATVSEVGEDWQGSSAEAFAAFMGRFTSAAGDARRSINAAAQTLEEAAAALENAHVSVEHICENLLGEVNRLKAGNPDAPASQLNAQISGLAAEAAAAARPKVAEAAQALTQARAALGQDLSMLSRTFGALPQAGARTFVPGGGKPPGWVPAGGHGPGSLAGSKSHGFAPGGGGGVPVSPGSDAGASGWSGTPVLASAGSSGSGSSGSGSSGSAGSGSPGGSLDGGVPSGISGGGPAAPAQVKGWIDQAIKILEARGIPASKLSPQDIWIIIQHESGGNPTAVNNWDCVTLDTLILTRRGWLKHDEVRCGDETIGFHPRTGRSQWTPISEVVHFEDAPLARIGNARWIATVTPNHRWLNLPRITEPKPDMPDACPLCDWPVPPPLPAPHRSCPECGWVPNRPGGVPIHRARAHGVAGKPRSERPETFRRRGKTTKGGVRIHLAKVHGLRSEGQRARYETNPQWVITDAIRTRDRILVAAPADTVSTLDITVEEAAILGWIAGDGHVETRKHRPTISIAQSKPEMVERLHVLLKDVPHAVHVDDRGGCGPRHQFRLQYDYAQDLLRRSGHPTNDAVSIVLSMSAEQRAAWLSAVIDAEGSRSVRPGFTRPQTVVYQCQGPLLEAIKLAVYLSGARPSVGILSGKPQWAPCYVVGINRPIVTGGFLRREDAGRGDVWCVRTELGSWTAEQDGQIFLTGNSNAAAGTPSIGIMQTIQPTFNSYALPGHGDIRNPVDNIIAGVRYALARYGSLDNVPGVAAVHAGRPYVGY